MGDWKHSTRECTLEGLPGDMTAAVKKHVEQYNLGAILSEPLMCVETSSDKIEKSLLDGGDKTVITGAIVTPRWLLWAIRGDRSGMTVMSARLGDIVVQDYATTQFARMVPDSGIEVSGSFTDVAERGSAFIGLEEGAVSKKFKETIIKAMEEAKK